MNTSATINWYDPDNRDSYLLCLDFYGIKCINSVDVDEDTTEITVYGPTENITKFLEDYEEDTVEPLNEMCISLEYDEDYEGWLNNEVYAFKQLAEFERA